MANRRRPGAGAANGADRPSGLRQGRSRRSTTS